MTDLKNTQQPKNFKILLIGDSCIDEYQYGTVDRLSPEAPVPVLKITHKETRPGMAANVQENLKSFGIQVTALLGPNSQKVRIIDQRSGQHIVRIDNDVETKSLTNSNIGNLEFDAIVISDYNKGYVSYDLIHYLQENFEGPIFIDTKKTDLAKFKKCFVKINEYEYSLRTSTCENLIVTLGERGAMYKKSFVETYYRTDKVEMVDVCGAGDTFLAALVSEYLLTQTIEKAIEFANKCSAVTVGHQGVYALTQADIERIKNGC